MAITSNRLTGLFVVIASVMLALTIGALFYYFKIKQNENYQNQLHFRELKFIATSLDNGIDQLMSTADQQHRQYPEQELNLAVERTLPEVAERPSRLQRIQSEREMINKSRSRIRALDEKFSTGTSPELQSLGDKNAGLEKEAQAFQAEIALLEESLRAASKAYEKALYSVFETRIYRYGQDFLEQQLVHCQQSGENSCEWLDKLGSNVLTPQLYAGASTAEEIAAAFASNVTQHLIEGRVVSQALAVETEVMNEKIERVTRWRAQFYQQRRSAQTSATPALECAELAEDTAGLCRRLAEFMSGKITTARTGAPIDRQSIEGSGKDFYTSREDGWSRLDSELNHVFRDLKSRQEFLQKLSDVVNSVMQGVSMVVADPAYVKLLETIRFTSDELGAVRTRAEKNQGELAELEDQFVDAQNVAAGYSQSDVVEVLTSERTLLKQKLTSYRAMLTERIENEKSSLQQQRDALTQALAISAGGRNSKLLHVGGGKQLLDAYDRYVDCVNQYLDDEYSSRTAECAFEGVGASIQNSLLLFSAGTALRRAIFEPALSGDSLLAWRGKPDKLQLMENIDPRVPSAWKVITRFGPTTAFISPLDDLINVSIDRHPLVLLVDKSGKRLLRKENVMLDDFQHGLQFEQIEHLLASLFARQSAEVRGSKPVGADGEKTSAALAAQMLPGYSGSMDLELAGEEYRLFVTPYRNEKLVYNAGGGNGPQSVFYLVGFTPTAHLLAEKLSISNSIVLGFVLVILVLLMLIPLLKIRLISFRQAFSNSDRRMAMASLVFLTGIAIITSYDLWFYQQLKAGVARQSDKIFAQVQNRFKDELTSLESLARQQWKVQETGKWINPDSRLEDRWFSYDADSLAPAMGSNQSQAPRYFLENLFRVEGDPKAENYGVMDARAYWSTSKFSRSNNAIDLRRREYFRRAAACDVWYADDGIDRRCERGVYIERIFNLRDGRRTTQVAHPLPDVSRSGHHAVLSYGTRLQTFLAPVLPPHFGVLVFDNKSGNVLYHSDGNRSLVENIFVETDTDAMLALLVEWSRRGVAPQRFTTSYRGDSHVFTVGSLRPGIPWTLVVYFNKLELRSLNLLVAGGTLVALILGTMLSYVLLSTLPRHLKWQALRWVFGGDNEFGRRGLSGASGFRFMLPVFTVALALLFFFHVQGVELLRRYEYLQNAHLERDAYAANVAKRAYQDIVLDFAKTGFPKPRPSNSVLCYLGKLATVDLCVYGDESTAPLAARETSGPPLSLYQLSQALFNTHQLTPGLVEAGLQYRLERPRFFTRETLWSLLLFLLCVLGLTAIAHRWIAQRLLGFHIPEQFRTGDNTANDWKNPVCGSFPLAEHSRFVQVIRPEEEMLATLSCPSGTSNPHGLLTPGPIAIAELLGPGFTAAQIVAGLLAKNQLTQPLDKAQTLVIKGFEAIAMDGKLRPRALELLETLMGVRGLRLVILCEVAPLFRLTHQGEYPHSEGDSSESSTTEVVRWSSALRQFRKIYDWTPVRKSAPRSELDTLAVLESEAIGWPELREIWNEFWVYHCNSKDTGLAGGTFEPGELDAKYKDSLAQHWQSDQIVEYFGANAGAFYRYRWELCTKDERLLLYQLAIGEQPNPANLEPLEHLIRRGYIYRDCRWHLVNRSFQRFALTAESEARIAEWIAVSRESNWKYLRIPLFAIVIALLAIVAYSATDALESALAVFATVLSLIPMAIRNLALFKGEGGSGGR